MQRPDRTRREAEHVDGVHGVADIGQQEVAKAVGGKVSGPVCLDQHRQHAPDKDHRRGDPCERWDAGYGHGVMLSLVVSGRGGQKRQKSCSTGRTVGRSDHRAKGETMLGRITVPVPMEVGSMSRPKGRLGIVLVEPLPRGEENVGGSLGEFCVSCPLAGPVGHI